MKIDESPKGLLPIADLRAGKLKNTEINELLMRVTSLYNNNNYDPDPGDDGDDGDVHGPCVPCGGDYNGD